MPTDDVTSDDDDFTDADRTKMSGVIKKLREENRSYAKDLKEIRTKLAEREATDERAREDKMREEGKREDLLKERDAKIAKLEALNKQQKEAYEGRIDGMVTDRRFQTHAAAVATKAEISVKLMQALLREAGGGEVKDFAPEQSTPELVEAHLDKVKELAPELFNGKGSSGGSPGVPKLNPKTKGEGELSLDDKRARARELGQKHGKEDNATRQEAP